MVTAHIAGIEVDTPRAIRAVRIEGRRPVGAIGARTGEAGGVPETSEGKEDTVPIGGGYPASIYTILGSPRALGTECRPLSISGHTPFTAE